MSQQYPNFKAVYFTSFENTNDPREDSSDSRKRVTSFFAEEPTVTEVINKARSVFGAAVIVEEITIMEIDALKLNQIIGAVKNNFLDQSHSFAMVDGEITHLD